MSEKCPSGGIGRRSITRTPPCRAAQSAKPAEAEFRPPAEPARDRRKPLLEQAARARFGADVVDQHDLAARLEYAGELVERCFRIGHRGDDVLRHHHVEEIVRQRQALRRPSPPAPRHCESFCSATRSCALRSIGSDRSTPTSRLLARIVGQRNAGADADFEDAPAGGPAGGARPPRSPPCARARTPRRRRGHRLAPSAHRRARRCACRCRLIFSRMIYSENRFPLFGTCACHASRARLPPPCVPSPPALRPPPPPRS